MVMMMVMKVMMIMVRLVEHGAKHGLLKWMMERMLICFVEIVGGEIVIISDEQVGVDVH